MKIEVGTPSPSVQVAKYFVALVFETQADGKRFFSAGKNNAGYIQPPTFHFTEKEAMDKAGQLLLSQLTHNGGVKVVVGELNGLVTLPLKPEVQEL